MIHHEIETNLLSWFFSKAWKKEPDSHYGKSKDVNVSNPLNFSLIFKRESFMIPFPALGGVIINRVSKKSISQSSKGQQHVSNRLLEIVDHFLHKKNDPMKADRALRKIVADYGKHLPASTIYAAEKMIEVFMNTYYA